MHTGLVSIMMPAYNAEAYIGPAIKSVLAQSYAHWELVVVDDGSRDDTAAIASRFGDSRIKVVRQQNQGEAAARNTALRNIRGEFLAFLDADDLYLPQHLESTVGYLSTHPQIHGVYTDGYYIDQAGKRLKTLSSRRRGPFEGGLFEEVVRASDVFGPPACVVLRTNLIHEQRLQFDESIVIGPDWDFFMKYADLARFGYVDEITCLYRLHSSNISIRTAPQKRALELSKCRMNAVKMKNFGDLGVSVRTAVFYDLLVNLLIDFPEQQEKIIRRPEFANLPKKEQARLLRLMASKAMIHGRDRSRVRDWLDEARRLSPEDRRAFLLWLLFQIHPNFLRLLLRVKAAREVDPRLIPPLSDMNIGRSR